tara:strand:+ start:1313 stop:1627 length:315 start_codon:yes stop_codon:yes gene_type:complete
LKKVSINIIDCNGDTHIIDTQVQSNLNLMDVVRDAGFDMGNCGGMALCASCHCYVDHLQALNEKSIEEEQMLDQLPDLDLNKSRLICQIPVTPDLDGMTLILKN